MQPSSTGLIINARTSDQKEYDIKFSDVFGSPVPKPPNYLKAKPDISTYEQYPWENQMGESSCVAHSKVLNQAIYNSIKRESAFVQGGPIFVYRLRFNYPSEGMDPKDADNVLQNYGVPNYADCPNTQTEAQANALVITPDLYDLAAKNKSGNWATADDPTNIDSIAYATNVLGIPVSIVIFAQLNEYSVSTPQIIYPSLTMNQAVVQHCVTVLPNTAYIDPMSGKRFVMIQDSAFFGGIVYRSLSEDFIKARCVAADCIVELGVSSIITLPKYTFATPLAFGTVSKDVQVLQTCLQSMGFFPTMVNGQLFTPTQTYGSLTKNAILSFQNAYAAEILTPIGLNQGTGNFGTSTMNFINKLLNK